MGESDRDRCSKLLHLHRSSVASRGKRLNNNAVSSAALLENAPKSSVTDEHRNQWTICKPTVYKILQLTELEVVEQIFSTCETQLKPDVSNNE